jgi:hypothetical protein
MFGGNEPQGFTIIEVIIFLGVSGLLFLSVLGLINNEQNKTQFFQGIHEFYSQIQNLSNNVQIGYYTNSGDFTCSANGGGAPVISSGANNEGANYGCTFIGRVLQFAPNDNTSQYSVYTVVGRQFTSTTPPGPVDTITEALPVVITGSSVTNVNLPPGLVISKVSYLDSGVTHYDSLVGFFTNFPDQVNGGLASGSLTSALIPIPSNTAPSTFTTVTPTSVSGYVSDMQNDGTNDNITTTSMLCNGNCDAIKDPAGGVVICLQSTGINNYYALVTIGGNSAGGNASGNALSTQLTDYEGSACP